ncbi:MAG: AIR carboxylase family protein, partial [Lentisphaeria bacterium]|nr:AIR carboxylase family protein [Lentisphaeria bacterium]
PQDFQRLSSRLRPHTEYLYLHLMGEPLLHPRLDELLQCAGEQGFKVIICAAGMAAHLGGVVAAHTTLPVIGIPVASEPFNGLDALFSFIQMPPGIPVAAVTAGKAGGKNSALYAISILALSDEVLAQKLKEFRAEQAAQVLKADAELQLSLQK